MDGTENSWPFRILPSPNDKQCVGDTKHGKRCKNPVSKRSTEKAKKVMLEMALLAPGSDEVQDHLRYLASLFLCRHYHQDQASQVVEEWNKQLHRDIVDPVEPVEPVETSRSSSGADIHEITLQSLHQEEFYPTHQRIGKLSLGGRKSVLISVYDALPMFPDKNCEICYKDLRDEPDYLHCRMCRQGQYHLSCLRTWSSEQGWDHVRCPTCREGKTFALYHQEIAPSGPAPIRESVAMIRESRRPEASPNTAPETTSSSIRRSGRRRQPPERYQYPALPLSG